MSPKNSTASIVAALRATAGSLNKSAGAPDSMTSADGQGGISTQSGSPKKDPGETDLKRTQPADGTANPSSAPGGAPDSMTTADGQGGITTASGTPKKDPGEEELKRTQPADAERNKSAHERVASIAAALHASNPTAFKAPQQDASKQARNQQPGADLKDVSDATLVKLARAILATEEGVAVTSRLLAKQAGESDYAAMIAQATADARAYDEIDQIKSAAFDEGVATARNVFGELQGMGISEADAGEILKSASVHVTAIMELDHPMLKAAYAQGMDDAAAMDEGMEAGAEEGALPMGGEQLSPEDAMALLQQLVAEGVITEQEVQDALAQAGAGAPPEGGEAPPEGELPPEAAGAPAGAPPM